MKTHLILGVACVILGSSPALAQSSTSTTAAQPDGSTTTTTKTVKKDNTGTLGGAGAGAVAGALVAGPIGAVVGGVAGAAVGHTIAPPKEVRSYVTTQTAPPAAYSGPIDIGKRLDGDIAWRDVPDNPRYHWAHLNDERVVIDDNHTVVAVYTD